MIALLAAQAASGAEWVAAGEAHGCVIELREASETGKSGMRGTCTWPDVPPEKLISMFSRFDRYEDFISPVAESRVERSDANRSLVYQRHSYFGISDREMLLWMTTVQREGSTSFEWTTASSEPLTLQNGTVRAVRNVGRWSVTPLPEGGSMVVHEISLDPGGSVPNWIVRMARGRGFAKILGDVHAYGAR